MEEGSKRWPFFRTQQGGGAYKKQLVRLSLPLVPDRTLKYGFSEKIVGTLSHSTSTVQFFYNPIFKI